MGPCFRRDDHGEIFEPTEFPMTLQSTRRALALSAAVLLAGTAARAADVTYERLMNPEPQNWLMNHHDFASQRFSSLSLINNGNV
jgi:hypothetical protein